MKRHSNSDFAFDLPGEWPYRDESDATAYVAVFGSSNIPEAIRR